MTFGERGEWPPAESAFRLMNDRWGRLRRKVDGYLETLTADAAEAD